MDNPEHDDTVLPLSEILDSLSRIRGKLIEINEKNGNIANYIAMRKEILEIGWSGILQKYHPDINIDDPAAFPLFELYKFVYDAIKKSDGDTPI